MNTYKIFNIIFTSWNLILKIIEGRILTEFYLTDIRNSEHSEFYHCPYHN